MGVLRQEHTSLFPCFKPTGCSSRGTIKKPPKDAVDLQLGSFGHFNLITHSPRLYLALSSRLTCVTE